ncbi:uncharacterized protein B0T23DRAFT_103741 [Neurospora hispaniola]|uniref:Uncharacterized protein n=1 Tax=Neurospora hispaniola TaxID=588809 RepID=A0AAJ0I923_9PEZI|nr:hypothetical protein B0T23DRAFT_103741 [Neurospora hispaniola]
MFVLFGNVVSTLHRTCTAHCLCSACLPAPSGYSRFLLPSLSRVGLVLLLAEHDAQPAATSKYANKCHNHHCRCSTRPHQLSTNPQPARCERDMIAAAAAASAGRLD